MMEPNNEDLLLEHEVTTPLAETAIPNQQHDLELEAFLSGVDTNVSDDDQLTQMLLLDETCRVKEKKAKKSQFDPANDEVLHYLTSSDTLVGVSLKYGCSVQSIKKRNRIYSESGMWAKEFIFIPVNRDQLISKMKEEKTKEQLLEDRNHSLINNFIEANHIEDTAIAEHYLKLSNFDFVRACERYSAFGI
eukprot:TRINITY_DN2202_c0_g1_i2.p1 TRINITY_DN2202_c0_g1~~TRINITY_DN2202_c0_g1_i2.p1  ORF type:complete len:191 (-),score=48.15 TRINITY_DN2202_c0_g1_i2:337-909(-)